jgi:hypothetical protein
LSDVSEKHNEIRFSGEHSMVGKLTPVWLIGWTTNGGKTWIFQKRNSKRWHQNIVTQRQKLAS